MSENERRSWERARDDRLKQLRENVNPKLAPLLNQEIAIIEHLLSRPDGAYFCHACNSEHSG